MPLSFSFASFPTNISPPHTIKKKNTIVCYSLIIDFFSFLFAQGKLSFVSTKVKHGMTREEFLDSSQWLISILYKIWYYLSVSHFCILMFWTKGELHCPIAKIKSSDSYICSKQPANKGYVMYRLFHFVNAN